MAVMRPVDAQRSSVAASSSYEQRGFRNEPRPEGQRYAWPRGGLRKSRRISARARGNIGSVLFHRLLHASGRRPSRSPSPGQRPGYRWHNGFRTGPTGQPFLRANGWPVGPEILGACHNTLGVAQGWENGGPVGAKVRVSMRNKNGIQRHRQKTDFCAAQPPAIVTTLTI